MFSSLFVMLKIKTPQRKVMGGFHGDWVGVMQVLKVDQSLAFSRTGRSFRHQPKACPMALGREGDPPVSSHCCFVIC